MTRPFSASISKLRAVGLRPTRQRVALTKLLLSLGDQHFTADWLFRKARSSGIQLSLATVYNTLNQFLKKGLLKEIILDSNKSYFDTNTDDHHHLFFESHNKLVDIPAGSIDISGLPSLPEGSEVTQIDVIIRVK